MTALCTCSTLSLVKPLLIPARQRRRASARQAAVVKTITTMRNLPGVMVCALQHYSQLAVVV